MLYLAPVLSESAGPNSRPKRSPKNFANSMHVFIVHIKRKKEKKYNGQKRSNTCCYGALSNFHTKSTELASLDIENMGFSLSLGSNDKKRDLQIPFGYADLVLTKPKVLK